MRPHLTIQLPDSWGTVFGEGLRVSFQEEALLSRPSMPPECSGSPPGISLQGPAFPALVLLQLKEKEALGYDFINRVGRFLTDLKLSVI